jgi:hypothetical protein
VRFPRRCHRTSSGESREDLDDWVDTNDLDDEEFEILGRYHPDRFDRRAITIPTSDALRHYPNSFIGPRHNFAFPRVINNTRDERLYRLTSAACWLSMGSRAT